jgi:hypothetical protein
MEENLIEITPPFFLDKKSGRKSAACAQKRLNAIKNTGHTKGAQLSLLESQRHNALSNHHFPVAIDVTHPALKSCFRQLVLQGLQLRISNPRNHHNNHVLSPLNCEKAKAPLCLRKELV